HAGDRRGRGGGAAAARSAGGRERGGVPGGRGTWRPFLQRAPLPLWARRGGGGAGRARGRDPRPDRAAAQRAVRPAGVAGRPPRVGGLVAGDVGPGADRRGAGARDGRGVRLPGRVQRGPRGPPVVGAAGGLGARRARGGRPARAVPAARRRLGRSGDGARGRGGAAAVGGLPGRPFPPWGRGVLLGAAAVGCAILWWWRGRVTGLRYGLALLAVA